jgi:hypothetical protein
MAVSGADPFVAPGSSLFEGLQTGASRAEDSVIALSFSSLQ